MVGKSRQATKEQQKRFQYIQMGGCVACLQLDFYNSECEIHHLLRGYRRGHDYSVGLCAYHHRGILPEGLTYKQCKNRMGPSLAEESKAFHETFGDDDFLLELQNSVIEKVKDSIV